MQVQESLQPLERVSVMISQKAHGFIGQAIERTLQNWGLGDIQSEHGDPGHCPRGASAGEKGVSAVISRLDQI